MTVQELEKEQTEDLLEYMKWGDQPEHKDLADNAFIAFCLRYRDRVQRICSIIANKRGFDDRVGDEIAEYVFARVLKYKKYDSKICKFRDRDRCIELYLYGIAQNGLSNYEASGKNPFKDAKIETEFPDVEKFIDLAEEELPEEKKTELRKKDEIIKLALERLSPAHKTIYLTYIPYENKLNKGEHYMPRELLKQLQEKLGLSQITIRVYKNQAYKKIQEYLEIYGAK